MSELQGAGLGHGAQGDPATPPTVLGHETPQPSRLASKETHAALYELIADSHAGQTVELEEAA